MKTYGIVIIAFILYGCPSASIKEETIPAEPEIVMQFASLNLSDLNKRIERAHITELVKKLKQEKVEILAVQGIPRYPGIPTRIDFVNEVSKQVDWRSAFGEMQNISGRQTGNAVFSVYPIISHQNVAFENVRPSFFEAALHATIDLGILSLVVISTRLPAKASISEQTKCMESIAGMNSDADEPHAIISGNLPPNITFRSFSPLSGVSLTESGKNSVPDIWYSSNNTFRLLSTQTAETELGKMLIVKIGLNRKK